MRFVGKYSKLKKGRITATFVTTRIDAILICHVPIVYRSKKVTISKDKLSKVGSIINLLKRGSIYGYLLSEITNPQSVADGTMTAYRKRQKGEK